jgi:hypothetical protein
MRYGARSSDRALTNFVYISLKYGGAKQTNRLTVSEIIKTLVLGLMELKTETCKMVSCEYGNDRFDVS